VKNFLDPFTLQKIVLLNPNEEKALKELQDYIDINQLAPDCNGTGGKLVPVYPPNITDEFLFGKDYHMKALDDTPEAEQKLCDMEQQQLGYHVNPEDLNLD